MNRGQVILDVITRGTDEVSGILRKVGAQAKETEKQLDSMATSTAKIGNQTGPNVLVAGIKKVDGAIDKAGQGIEKFNKVIGIAGFIGAAVAAIPIVVELVKEIFKIEDASSNASKAIGEISTALVDAKKNLREYQIQQAASKPEAESIKILNDIEKVQDEAAKLSHARIEGESAVEGLLRKQAKVADELGQLELKRAELIKLGYDQQLLIVPHIEAKQRELLKTQNEIDYTLTQVNIARQTEMAYVDELNRLESKRKELIKESFAALFDGLWLERQVRQSLGLKVEPLAPTPKKKPTGRKPEEDFDRNETLIPFIDVYKEIAKMDEETIRRGEENTNLRIENEEKVKKAMKDLDIRLEVAAFKPIADDVAKATSAMQAFGDAVGAAASAFPDLSDALSETMSIWSKYGDRVASIQKLVADGTKTSAEATVMAEDEKTNAIIAGTTAGLAAVGKMIGGLKAEYALRALGELAWGFATLSKPEESTGHFVAAGLYALAAGTAIAAGGGGGARGAGAAGGGGTETPMTTSAPAEREPRTIVYNFSTLIADRQQVGRAIRDSELASERNGYGRRRGV